MLRWTLGTTRRGLAISLTWVAIGGIAIVGGIALAQNSAPVETPSTIPAPPAPNVGVPSPGISVMPAPSTAAVPPPQLFTQAQLDQLVAPIALYPDPLLAQILMASTYPLEVVEAARWVSAPANRGLSGDVMTTALQAQNWDPSIKALVPFPRILENMSDQLQWTEELGNVFLAQQADVMAAVQSLRHDAMAAGNLKQTPQCRCVIHVSGETISILPAEPQVVCVPVYQPAVYGRWSYPAYPPDYFPIPVGFAYPPGFWIGFEPPIELAFFGPFWGWGWVDWGHHHIAVDSGRFALASGGRPAFAGSVWVHNPAHRGGVAYADAASRARFDSGRVSALTAAERSGRGRDATAAARFGGAGAEFGRNEAMHGGVGRFGTAAIHGGAAISRSEATFHGAGGFHGGTAFRGEAGYHGAPTAHGETAFHGEAGFHSAAAHGGAAAHNGPAFHAGGPRGGGAPHLALGGPHGGGAPRGGGAPHFAMGGPRGGGGAHSRGPHDGGGPDGHHG
jgi:hypothetical protein